MMDMAIGVIIGGAFSTLVTSLTDNLISPIMGILGKVNFDAMMCWMSLATASWS